MLKNLWCFGVLIALLFVACSKIDDVSNADVLKGDPEFAVPLAVANTSFQELIENFDDNTFITIDADGLIRLRYEGDVSVRTSQEILEEAVESLPTLLPLSQTNPDTLPFNSPEELEVDSAVVKMGAMVGFGATRDPSMPSIASIKITLPQVRQNGQPLILEANYPLGLTVLGYNPIDIGGYALVPEDGKLNVEYEALDENGELVTFGENGYALVITLEDFDFTYIEGFLGYRLHDGDRDTLSIDFFENWIQGEVYFEDPEIRINLENSFGIPTRSVINVFDIYTATGEVLPLESDVLNIADNQGIDFLFPTVNQVGEVLTQTFVFDKNNSNIRDVLGSQPVALDYDVDARTNPDSLVNIRGFLTDESFYKVQVEVELPMYGWARGFIATDTFDVNFADFSDISEVEFKLVSDNGTPLDIATQAYFVDDNFNIIDSLLTTPESLIAAAPVDSDGVVVEPFTKSTLIPYSAERFNRIRDATQILLQTAFSTVNDGGVSVKVFAKDEVSIRMGMKVKTD
jgi:hypothetical protein